MLLSAHTVVFMCYVWTWNKQRLFPCTALTAGCYDRYGVCLLCGTDWMFIIQVNLSRHGIKSPVCQDCKIGPIHVIRCRGSSTVAAHIVRLWTRRRRVVSFTPRPLNSWKKTPETVELEARWAPEQVWNFLRREKSDHQASNPVSTSLSYLDSPSQDKLATYWLMSRSC